MSNSESNSIGPLIVAGLIGGVIAAVINAILFFVVPDLNVSQPDGSFAPVGLVAIIMASIVPAIFAAIFLWLLRRFTGNGTRIFQIVGVIFLLVSFASPFAAAATTGIAIWLNVMHLVAGAAIIWALTMR